MWRAIAGALAALTLGNSAPAAPPEPLAMTPQEQALLQAAIDRGVLLYAYDQAAWHGSDDMREKMKDRLGEVGAWIVDGPASAPHLLFLDRDEANPHVIYAADFNGGTLAAS